MQLDMKFLTLPTSGKSINIGGIKRWKKYSKEKNDDFSRDRSGYPFLLHLSKKDRSV